MNTTEEEDEEIETAARILYGFTGVVQYISAVYRTLQRMDEAPQMEKVYCEFINNSNNREAEEKKKV